MTHEHDMRYRSAAITDRGLVRKVNQDACLALPDLGIWIVADGVGGHQRGDTASQMLVEAIGALPPIPELRERVDAVRHEILAVNRRLIALGESSVIASTVAVLVADARECVSLWAGDSRIYGFRQGRLSRLTRDHSLVEDLVAEGQLTPEQARTHPEANAIYRAVGKDPDLELEARLYDVRPHDRFLLCTDGLTKEASDAEIAERLAEGDCDSACAALVTLAMRRGARDNIAVILVDAPARPDPEPDDALGDTMIAPTVQISRPPRT